MIDEKNSSFEEGFNQSINEFKHVTITFHKYIQNDLLPINDSRVQ